jgi:hypothetical protein
MGSGNSQITWLSLPPGVHKNDRLVQLLDLSFASSIHSLCISLLIALDSCGMRIDLREKVEEIASTAHGKGHPYVSSKRNREQGER